ncbi:6-phosphogluconolactonase [candidate division KSB1 bacterium]|nr:6-phosphogluconolactonase [candidate division KSB1 bacterium]RQW06107.1 MAG: 6-phosphogluconolactonase [candidate division KSB1 bacterium]
MKTDLKIVNSKENLGIYAADLFAELSEKYIKKNGKLSVALSGGSTPKIMYQKLVDLHAEDIHWDYIDFFWSDERYVPFDHPDSNGGMAYKYLLSPLDISQEHYFPVPTSYKNAPQGAMEYEETIRNYFKAPVFDVIFLGMGEDGHTASLFPNTRALSETRRLVTANWVDKFTAWRITFTFSLLNQARHIIFLVSGAEKARITREILKDKSLRYPSALVQPTHGQLLWLLDADAGKELL